jgi:SAM-dependent methyltransferase
VISDVDLGAEVLEIGPGPGLTTDELRVSIKQLTALEVDRKFAGALASRLQGSNVRVLQGDATNMPFGDSAFSGVVSFAMLHHVPSHELQDSVLREVVRVLRPGGFFVGSDSLPGWRMRIIHVRDTFVPVNPDTFATRLERAGFEVLDIQRRAEAFRFRARRPRV